MTAAGAIAIRRTRRRAWRRSIRLKAPQNGQTVIQDAVQGEVKVENAQLDDMILLRADGTPTYMHAVVVDDHDMGITHVIRGDDHLNNAFRQLQIIKAMGWPEPVYAHIPLIHGADGAKLSKRHGALGVDAYRDMGFLPEALRNYLLRLGWGHGDDEIISTKQAIEWFDLPGVGRSPSRFDMVKLTNLNAHYLREAPDAELLPLVLPRIELKLGRAIDAAGMARIERGMNGVKQRSRTVIELADNLVFYASDGAPPIADDKARAQLTPDSKALLARLAAAFEGAERLEREAARGGRAPLRRGREREAGPGRPAAARGAHRLDRVARHLRGRGDPGLRPRPRQDCSPPADRSHGARLATVRRWHCASGSGCLSLSVLWGGSFFFAKVALGELGPFTVVFARVSLAALALASGRAAAAGRAVAHLFRHGLPEQRPALQPDLLGPDRDRLGPGLDPQRHHAALHPGRRPRPHARREDRPDQDRRPADRTSGRRRADRPGRLDRRLGVWGQLACLGAALSYAFAGVYGRRFRRMGIAPAEAAAGQVTASAVLILPIMLVVDQPWTLSAPPSLTVWLALAGLALLSTALAYVLYFRILAAAGATNLLLVTFLIPVPAILLGAAVLGEQLEPRHFAGMALIGLGLAADRRPDRGLLRAAK